ncbi:hypothetical protein ACFOPQ_01275 [Deinococcus antarcticus]|uniref:Prohead serine protease n=1 Tax=Deinococcus antarcticus TaxID=1298767 RepID=A0ABV8A4G3_9DEIO
MDQLNRSPCTTTLTTRLLRENVHQENQTNIRLSERLTIDAGNATIREEKRGDVTVTVVDVTVATAGRVNRNMRLYSREVWQIAIDAAQQDIQEGKLWGLVEHPKDTWDDWGPLKGRLENIWIKYEKLWMEGPGDSRVRATGVLIETAAGADMKALLTAKLAVGISTNGLGSVKYYVAKEFPALADHPDPEALIGVIQDDYRLLTIDAVSDPSDLSGTAWQKETHRPKEGNMHKLLKDWLATKPGLTLDQAKQQFRDEYLGVLEKIAQESVQDSAPAAPRPTPVAPPVPAVNVAPASAPAPTSDAESTLERNVLALNARLEASERQAFTQARTNVAISALEAAQLPRAPKVGDLDLDARFREQLINAAVAAQSDDEAKSLVDQMITERRAITGAAQQQGKARESVQQRAQGVSLPVGNNSAPNRALEGHNPVAAARAVAGLK